MDWIRNHPYATALTGACILVILGTWLIINRSNTPAPTGVSAWIGNPGVSIVPSPATVPTNTGGIVVSSGNYGTQTLPYTVPASTTVAIAPTSGSGTSFDFDAFLAELSNASTPKQVGSPSSTTAIDSNAWTYIPSGLVSTSSGMQKRTPAQQALYVYGNEVGSYVQGYNNTHQDQVQIMKNALNDRQNTSKAQAVASIGIDMETVGEGITEISDAPSEALFQNTALANSYTDSGKKLVAVAAALPGRDTDLAKAIETYHTSIGTFVTNYVALANLFKAYGVTFAPSDAGSVFMFTSSNL